MKIHTFHRFVIQASSYFVRLLLKLRYQVRFEGLEKILPLREGKTGILFLPNHPAEIDPVILMAILGPSFWPKSVIVEHFYHLKGFKKILDLARVVPLPTMAEKANRWRGKELEKTAQKVQKELIEGENYIIYPSGKLKRGPLEQIGGASFVYNLLNEREDIPVVLVRTTGLWGSSFSTAQTGETPRFQTVLKNCFFTLLKNAIFFTPKREVLVQFEWASSGIPRKEPRLVFNKFLEQWYNQYPYPGEEPLSLVPYLRWKPKEVPFKAASVSKEESVELPPETEAKVIEYLSSLSSLPAAHIRKGANLSMDLGLDSLDIAQVHLFLDKTFGVEAAEPGSLVFVSDVFRAIAEQKERPVSNEKERVQIPHFSRWKEKRQRKAPSLPRGGVFPEVFLRSCDRMGKAIACADRLTGVLSYQELKRAALVLQEKIRKIPGEKIGVLLPSSAAGYLVILAVYLADKVPVMLNWTAGKLALGHATKTSGFQAVLTSKKFLDKVQLEDLTEIEELFVFLEDIKGSVSWKDKIKGAFLSLYSADSLIDQLAFNLDSDQPAVILFTSGTEALPKAVPLTHGQILTNQKSAFSCIEMVASDVFYSVLPPFHSLGFSLTGLLPLLFGIKVFYAPDPTDSRQLASDIEETGISLFCSAPSFVRALFAESRPHQLSTLRILVVGAERMPKELYHAIKRELEDLHLLEGYGITECAPVVTLQRFEGEGKGVGLPIPGVKLQVLDPESFEMKKLGEQGEICIHSPSLFEGYIGQDCRSFFYQKGEKWYRSGDLGYIDGEGILYLTDRLKRTMKIGAEMVALGGVEDELLRIARENSWISAFQEGPPLAVVAREDGNQKAEIVLFTTFPIDRESINHALRDTGFGRIVKIAEVFQVQEIPLTGTGKIHHRMLEERIKQKKELCQVYPSA